MIRVGLYDMILHAYNINICNVTFFLKFNASYL